MQLCLSPSWGGLEMSALRFADSLAAHGHSSICGTLEGSPLEANAKMANYSTLSLKKPSRLWPFGASLKLRRSLIENKVDLVFVHHLKDLSVLLPALVGLKKIKLIGLSHVLVKKSKKDFYHRFLYSFLSRMIVFTKAQQDLSIPVLPVEPDRYAVIPGFVDTQVFNSQKRSENLRKSWRADEGDLVFGTIGRLDEQKGQAEFLQALALLRSREPDAKWKAVLIGAVTANEGRKGYSAYVRSLMTELKLNDQVQLLGFLPDPSSAMASLDVFVLPSYKETFGLVVLEAMASGAIPVVTDAGGPPDIIADAGLKVPPKNVEALAEALLQLIHHPEKRGQLAVAAVSRAQTIFGRDVVGKQLDTLVRSQLS